MDTPSPEGSRLPIDTSIMPTEVAHIWEERGENFRVTYLKEHSCQDGKCRKTFWYRCRGKGTPPDSDKHKQGHCEAEASAWRHVQLALDAAAAGKASDVTLEHGRGQLHGGGAVRYHGDPYEGWRFHTLPAKFDFLQHGVLRWRPEGDTMLDHQDFCCSSTFVRRFANGEAVWQCHGHSIAGGTASPPRDIPESLRGRPLEGKRMVEVFSGTPAEGGGALSDAFGDAGGTAIRHDIRLDARRDFMEDGSFWDGEFADPADIYAFGIPCTSSTPAHTTPITRSMDDPYGWGHQAAEGNKMAGLMIRRILYLLSRGAAILIENPLRSFLWLLAEVAGITGMPGGWLIRADQCAVAGTPFQKPQVWFSTGPDHGRSGRCVPP